MPIACLVRWVESVNLSRRATDTTPSEGTFQGFTKPSVRYRCPLQSEVVGGRSPTGRHCRVTTMTLEGSQSDAEQPHIRVNAGRTMQRTTAWSPGADNHGEAATSPYRERGPRSVCSDGDSDQSPVSGSDRRIVEAGDMPQIWRRVAYAGEKSRTGRDSEYLR
jgi:hypothetical protein